MSEHIASIIKYARSQNLATDYLKYSPNIEREIPNSHMSWSQTLEDDSKLESSPIDDLESRLKEKLKHGGNETLRLLSATKPAAFQGPIQSFPEDLRPIKRLRLELPVLKSDHEIDLLEWNERFHRPTKDDLRLLPAGDEEEYSGVWLPASYHRYSRELEKIIDDEKVVAGKQVLEILQEAIRPQLSPRALEEITTPSRTKRSLVEPITPPLLPHSPPLAPYVPSSPARLHLVSDPVSLTSADLAAVDQTILGEDILQKEERDPNQTENSSSETLLQQLEAAGQDPGTLQESTDKCSEALLKDARFRHEELKIDPPLFPAGYDQIDKPSSFEQAMDDIALDLPLPAENAVEEEAEEIKFFEEAFRDIANEAMTIVDNEKLKSADSMSRMDVPDLDFTIPPPPWMQDSVEALTSLMESLKYDHLSQYHWPGEDSLSLRLQWKPFADDIGKYEVEESVKGGDNTLKAIINEVQAMTTETEKLVWKENGLRMLDADENTDEKISPAVFGSVPSLDVLIKHRKRDQSRGQKNENDRDDVIANERMGATGSESLKPVRANQSVEKSGHAHSPSPSGESSLDEVDRFMQIQTGTRPTARKKIVAKNLLVRNAANGQEDNAATKASLSREPNLTTEGLPKLPTIATPMSSASFIISSTLLMNISLASRIRKLFPSAELVERDFDSAASDDPLINAQEADLILSPSTGLMWTSLSSLSQKSLPGRAAQRNPVHKRIIAVAKRYEKTIVLVCEARVGSTKTKAFSDSLVANNGVEDGRVPWGTLSPHDAASLVEVMGLSIAIRDDVRIMYVPGGEPELANWIVRMMIQYGIFDRKIELLEDVTEWELFLRRAGMNAFAAQVVLADLKLSQGHNVDHPKGLEAFVLMSRRDRIDRFQLQLGGQKVLNIVSDVIDTKRW